MRTFEQWWLKYYKFCVIAGFVFLIIKVLQKDYTGFDIKGAVVFFAIITSPVGALIGQIFVWIFKLIKLLFEIFLEYRKLRKQRR